MTAEDIERAIANLRNAIRMKNKTNILGCYKFLESVRWEDYSWLFEEYDSLISKANNILYS